MMDGVHKTSYDNIMIIFNICRALITARLLKNS